MFGLLPPTIKRVLSTNFDPINDRNCRISIWEQGQVAALQGVSYYYPCVKS